MTFVAIFFAILAMVMAVLASTMHNGFSIIVSLVIAMLYLAMSVLAAASSRG